MNRYDGLNRRIVRDNTGGGGEIKHFYYNQEWQVLVEADPNYDATAMYSYHPHYVDAVAVRMRDADAHVYLQDANFNVTAVVDDAGSVVERYSYTPYGEVIFLDSSFAPRSSSLLSNEILYTGRRRDPETGLQINRNRFYASHLGRWVNRDPIGYEGSQWNLYEYVGGRPSTLADPNGQQAGFIGRLPYWQKNGFESLEDCIEDCVKPRKNFCRAVGGTLGTISGYIGGAYLGTIINPGGGTVGGAQAGGVFGSAICCTAGEELGEALTYSSCRVKCSAMVPDIPQVYVPLPPPGSFPGF